VIHYTSTSSDTAGDNSIMITNFDHFLRGQDSFFVVDFERLNRDIERSAKLKRSPTASLGEVVDRFITGQKYHIYTPEEAIERAMSLLGESEYSLLFNNCEHFAFWAKTGSKECNQSLIAAYRKHIQVG